MCSPTLVSNEPTVVTTTTTTTTALDNNKANMIQSCSSRRCRRVSFAVSSPTVISVERLDLDFYTSKDFALFRQELAEEVALEAQTKQAAALFEKRKRGYQKLAARRMQRATPKVTAASPRRPTAGGCLSSHLSSHAQLQPTRAAAAGH